MATRSAIGMRTHDNRIKAVYCHWDGYLEGVGATLLNSYKDVFKVNQLLDKGNISSLESTIKATVFYKDSQPGFDDDYVIVNTYEDLFEYFEDCEYFYVFENDQWIVSTGSTFNSLADTLKETENDC